MIGETARDEQAADDEQIADSQCLRDLAEEFACFISKFNDNL